MKKIEFKLKDLELVKGCPTDINGNNIEDDDYNNDGLVDQDDQDYFDGYMVGYQSEYGNEGDGVIVPNDENSEAYNAGLNHGWADGDNDTNNGLPFDPNIFHENYHAPEKECDKY